MTDVMALLMGKGDLYPFSDYLKNYTEKSKGAVKPEIFNLISSQPHTFFPIMAASHVLAGKKDQFLHVRGFFPAVQNLDLKLNVTDAGLDWG